MYRKGTAEEEKRRAAASDDSSMKHVKGYDFSSSNLKNNRFQFGPKDSQSVSVDQTLAHLFDTLSVECCGILVYPQWKHFRHIRMLKNDQIRLSNGIWRSWHLQFQKKRTPLYCWFEMDPELNHHAGQEAVVLEGKYWKRRPDAVAKEYRKWRFYREKSMKKPSPHLDKVREKAASIFYELTGDVEMKSQEMQVDSSRASTLLQNAEDFALKLFQNNSSGSLDRYNGYGMMMQQPSLDMLNPMLDDFLNKLSAESIDGMMVKPSPQPRPPSFLSGPSFSHTSFTSIAQQQQQQQPQTQSSLFPSQQDQQQQENFQMSLDNLQSNAQKELQQSSIMQQESFPSSYPSQYLSGYQDTQMTEQMRYSPSTFLNLTQDQSKGEGEGAGGGEREVGALNIQQQVENFPMKCEPSLEDQLTMKPTSSSRNMQDSVYPSAGMDQGFQQNQMNLDYDGRGIAGSEALFRTQIGGLNPVFYQSEQESLGQEMTVPSLHSSSGSRTPQESVGGGGGGGGGGTAMDFQYNTPSSMTTPPPPPTTTQQQRKREEMMSPFVRVASAGELSACSSRPPLERGKSEPSRLLQDKVRSLNAQHIKQMKELDKQKNIAEVQYSELLMELMPQQGKTEQHQQALQSALSNPSISGSSEQQQQVLHSVLSDPNLVKILRSMLLTGAQQNMATATSPPLTPGPGPSTTSTLQPSSQEGMDSVEIPLAGRIASQSYHPPQHFGSPNVLSPTELAQATGVSDFQSRLLVAAVSHVKPTPSSTSIATASSLSPSGTASNLISLGSPTFPYDAETSPTQTMINKFKNSRHLTSSEKEVYKEIRRQSHISAEQKRRGSIKQGFDHLQSLVINTSAYPSGKVSKAVILEKTLGYIQRCHGERDIREEQIRKLKARIEELNAAISLCQERLPASGVPVTRQRFEENRQRFVLYIQKRTLQNYKFWILSIQFSIILQQLFESYNSMVSIGTVDELCRTVLAWFEQNCTLPALRPIVMNSLKELSLKTSILSDPSQVPRQLAQYAQQSSQQEQDSRTRRQQELPIDMSSLYS